MVNYRRRMMLKRKESKIHIKHKFSEKQYAEMREKLIAQLKSIRDEIVPYFKSVLKRRIIKIHLENLEKAIKYYFNPHTQRTSDNIDNRYKKGAAGIFKITRFIPKDGNSEQVRAKVHKNIQSITNQLTAQVEYMKEIEEKRHLKRQNKMDAQTIF